MVHPGDFWPRQKHPPETHLICPFGLRRKELEIRPRRNMTGTAKTVLKVGLMLPL